VARILASLDKEKDENFAKRRYKEVKDVFATEQRI
jgi:hypothetical protein